MFLLTASKPITNDCKCGDTELFGRVKFVNSGADFRIRFTEQSRPDLYIRFVSRPAVKCGEWQVVDDAQDFTVQIVDYAEDFVVKYNTNVTGLN